MYTSIGGDLWFWLEQFARCSDQFEEAVQEIPIGIAMASSKESQRQGNLVSDSDSALFIAYFSS